MTLHHPIILNEHFEDYCIPWQYHLPTTKKELMFLLEMDPDDAVIHEDDVEFTHELAHEMVENGTHSRLSSALADVECSCHEQRAMDYDEIKWLEEHGIKFRLDAGGCWEGEPYVLIELFDREHAILFKLAFGGS